MSPKRQRKPVPREKRRWRSPPPTLRDPEAPGPEGLAVVDEVASEMGTVVWKSLRSVLLWADANKGQRKNLFPGEVAKRRKREISESVPPVQKELREALDQLTDLLKKNEKASPEDVGAAARRISAWAEENHAPRTALEFLQAAALCLPADGELALEVGRTMSRLGQLDRSEAWFWRAVGLSRRAKDWNAYIHAYLDHGKLMHRRQALPAARRSLLKALRRAVRQGVRAKEGAVVHALFLLERDAGNPERALAYGRRASQIFTSAAHPELPLLARDLASHWMDQGHFELAFPVLREAARGLRHDDLGAGLGALARAAGQVGDQDAFEEAVEELDRWWDGPGVARAWADVARGAVALDRRDEAREAAGRAETMARKHGMDVAGYEAAKLLKAIRSENRDAEKAKSTPPSIGHVDRLSRDLLAALRGREAVA